jgi:hypothetical protein
LFGPLAAPAPAQRPAQLSRHRERQPASLTHPCAHSLRQRAEAQRRTAPPAHQPPVTSAHQQAARSSPAPAPVQLPGGARPCSSPHRKQASSSGTNRNQRPIERVNRGIRHATRCGRARRGSFSRLHPLIARTHDLRSCAFVRIAHRRLSL